MNYAHNSKNAAAALETVSALGEAALFRADVMKKRGARKLVEQVTKEMGPIDILVVNATPPQPYCQIGEHEDRDFESMVEAYRKTIPVGRLGKGEDIASAVAFFASEAAGFITGQSLIVNGGRHLL